MLIAIEGIDGAGKSWTVTQLPKGIKSLHFPTEQTDDYLYDFSNHRELLQHYKGNLKEHLILDRYFFSTIVYQKLDTSVIFDFIRQNLLVVPDYSVFIIPKDVEFIYERVKDRESFTLQELKELNYEYEKLYSRIRSLGLTDWAVMVETSEEAFFAIVNYIDYKTSAYSFLAKRFLDVQ